MPKIAVTNALIFDGYEIQTDRTVTIDNGIIGTDATDARILDCSSMTLLPDLTDAHVHMLLNNDESTHLLKYMAECGVTTALDIGHLPAAVRNAFRGQAGLADLRFAGAFALRAGARIAGWASFPKPISATAQGKPRSSCRRESTRAPTISRWWRTSQAQLEILNALGTETRKQGKPTVAHAVRNAPF
jgi:hypothetical protein